MAFALLTESPLSVSFYYRFVKALLWTIAVQAEINHSAPCCRSYSWYAALWWVCNARKSALWRTGGYSFPAIDLANLCTSCFLQNRYFFLKWQLGVHLAYIQVGAGVRRWTARRIARLLRPAMPWLSPSGDPLCHFRELCDHFGTYRADILSVVPAAEFVRKNEFLVVLPEEIAEVEDTSNLCHRRNFEMEFTSHYVDM